MTRKNRDTIQLVILSIICGLLVWHAVHWHSTGMYLEIFEYSQTGKGYVTVLYNLGLMLVLGAALGFLMEKITGLIRSTKNP